MVKVAAPMMSMDASGSLGKAITFAKWKGRPYVRSLVKPANPKSGGQTGIRQMFAFLAQIWSTLTAGEQATWEDRADATTVSPFNAFVSYNMLRWRNFTGPTQDYPETETADSSTQGILAAVAGVRSITVTQPITVVGNCWAVAFFKSLTGTFDTAFDNLAKVVPTDGVNDVVFVDSPLEPGTYYYDTRPIGEDGLLGAEKGEVDATVT